MKNSAEQQIRPIEDVSHSLGGGDDRSGNDVAVSADVFRRRMKDDVYAVSDRLLKKRRSPAVVDAGERAVRACDVGNCGEIESAEHHRSRALEPDELRVRLKCGLDVVRLDVEQKRVLDAKPFELLRELHRRTVRVIHEDDVIPGVEQAEYYGTDRGHSGSECLA